MDNDKQSKDRLRYENIVIVNSEQEANSITHNGTFHCDEVFATVILSLVLPEVRLFRESNVSDKAKESISYIYDIGEGELDHHQKGGNGRRPDGISYASCGLMWNKCKDIILDKMEIDDSEVDRQDIFDMMDRELIESIDAHDNGEVKIEKTNFNDLTVSQIVANYNPAWDADEFVTDNTQFIRAVKAADEIFNEELQYVISKAKAKKRIDKLIEESENGILVLDLHMPWEDAIYYSKVEKAKDILYVVFPSRRGGYNVQAVPVFPRSFEVRKKLPEAWAGLRNKELQDVTGIESATFCHNARFLGVCEQLEDAIKMANLAINN